MNGFVFVNHKFTNQVDCKGVVVAVSYPHVVSWLDWTEILNRPRVSGLEDFRFKTRDENSDSELIGNFVWEDVDASPLVSDPQSIEDNVEWERITFHIQIVRICFHSEEHASIQALLKNHLLLQLKRPLPELQTASSKSRQSRFCRFQKGVRPRSKKCRRRSILLESSPECLNQANNLP